MFAIETPIREIDSAPMMNIAKVQKSIESSIVFSASSFGKIEEFTLSILTI
jgi:hypothetical protein